MTRKTKRKRAPGKRGSKSACRHSETQEVLCVQFADRIAVQSADHLAILKVNANRFYENMGIYSSVRSSTDLDAAGQFTESSYK